MADHVQSPAVLIRRATEADVATVRRINQAAIREICARDYAAEVIAGWLAGNSDARYLRHIQTHSFWMVEDDSTVHAFGSVHIDTARLESLFVAPPSVGKGIARRLLMHLEQVATAAGIEVLHLASSLSAQGFYARYGYSSGDGNASIRLASGHTLLGVPMFKSLRR